MTDQYVPALRQRFLEDMRIKGLQPKTQTIYLRAMRDFTRFLGHSPDSASPEELRAFQLDMKEKGVGAPTFNNRLTVLSFFFAATCPRPEMKRHMRYQRAAKKIPVVRSAEEVSRILEAAPGPGLRYRAAFSVAYGGGLRASEVTHLKVGDIDSDRMLIRVDQGKGRKDRHVMLSPSLLELLRDYYREARPAGWLFPGRNRVDPISTRQFNRAFGVACDFAEIKKKVSPHTLRHCFATHLLEGGTDTTPAATGIARSVRGPRHGTGCRRAWKREPSSRSISRKKLMQSCLAEPLCGQGSSPARVETLGLSHGDRPDRFPGRVPSGALDFRQRVSFSEPWIADRRNQVFGQKLLDLSTRPADRYASDGFHQFANAVTLLILLVSILATVLANIMKGRSR